MKRKSNVVRLYGRWRVLTGAEVQGAASSDWVNLADQLDDGTTWSSPRIVDGKANAGKVKRTSGTGYRVVGDKLIVLEPHAAPAPAA